ncbi:MAG: hypothetical protein R3B09_14995 [Nannocystaceae bacterium]
MSRAANVVAALSLVAPACGWVESGGRERIDARYRADEVLLSDPMANFFGVESKGSDQIRGNGALVLARDHLWFSLLTPKTELTIPLTEILEVSLVDSHLDKSVGRPLLHVRYRSDGGEDAAAWLVAEPERWRKALQAGAGGGA